MIIHIPNELNKPAAINGGPNKTANAAAHAPNSKNDGTV